MNLGTKSGFWMYSQWWWHQVLTEGLWRQNPGHRGEQSARGSVGQDAARLLQWRPGFHSAHRGRKLGSQASAGHGPVHSGSSPGDWAQVYTEPPWLLSPGHVWGWEAGVSPDPGWTTVAPSCDRSAVATPSPGGSMPAMTVGYLEKWRLQ